MFGLEDTYVRTAFGKVKAEEKRRWHAPFAQLIFPDQQSHCNGGLSGWGSAVSGGRALVEVESREAGQSGPCVPELASALPMTAWNLLVEVENPKGHYEAALGLRETNGTMC